VLLTLTTTRAPATDLGYFLHKHPDRVQAFEVPFGAAHVFYPEASEGRCTAALLLDVDPVGLVRRGRSAFALAQYVNDRPYVAAPDQIGRLRRREPLYRVPECVFGVLALESDPVDPRL
jgi:hypothetical protein